MRKDVGESIIKVGTNVSSLGAAGLIFFEDDMTIVSGMIASVVGCLLSQLAFLFVTGGKNDGIY